MNERIKELIEQATTKESFYPAGCNGHHEDMYYFDKQKFAELLVKECIAKIALEQDSADQNWRCKNGVHIAYELQKYFEAPQ